MHDPSELKEFYQKLLAAVYPEDIFGDNIDSGEDGKEQIEIVYGNLLKIIDPNLYPDDWNQREVTKIALQILNDLKERAKEKCDDGVYGLCGENKLDVKGFNVETAKRNYVIKSTLATGDLSMIYDGQAVGANGPEGQVIVKIIINPSDNDLALNEIKALKIFQAQPCQQSRHLPVLLDNFKTTNNQSGVVIRYFDGYDLYSVREKYPQGLDPQHVAWILARSLSALGYVHSQNIIHGNLEPAHIMIRPRDHNVFLADWSYACIDPVGTGSMFKVYNEPYSPPEVLEKKSPLPSSDIYALGKSMIYLLGGDPRDNSVPYRYPVLFKKFLQAMVLESALQRPRDAWELYRYLSELRTKIWGPDRFLELTMNK